MSRTAADVLVDRLLARNVRVGRHRQEQRLRDDQVRADGFPGQSGVRRVARAHRLREIRRSVRRDWIPLRAPDEVRSSLEAMMLARGEPNRGRIALTLFR